jgi:hypothetical protein
MKQFFQTLIFLFFLSLSFLSNAQLIGDFRSKASGNWGDNETWQVFNGISWDNATQGQFPGATNESNGNNVYLEAGFTVNLQADHSCKDLHLNTTADVIRISTQNNNLNVWGKMRFYEGNAPGLDTPSPVTSSGITGWISTGTSGTIRFKGTQDRIVMYKNEVNANNSNSGWNLDFAFDPGFTGQINDRIRATNIQVSSGVLFMNNSAGEFRIGTNNGALDNAHNGSFTIKSGATVKGGNGIFKKATIAADNIAVESNGNLIITNTTYILAAQTLNLNGNIILENTILNFPTTGNRTGAAPINIFSNLILKGAGTKILQNNITVNGTLRLSETASLSLNGFNLSYGSNGILEYNGSATQYTTSSEFPLTNGPFALVINNVNGVSLHESKSLSGSLTISAGKLLLGNNNLTLESTSPAISGSFSVNNMIVTNGTGKLTKIFSAPGTFLFPVGDTIGTDEYSKAEITVSSAQNFNETTYFGIRVVDGVHPSALSAPSQISRYWDVSSNMTNYSYSGSFHYNVSDIVGDEINMTSFVLSDESIAATRVPFNSLKNEEDQISIFNVTQTGFVTAAAFCNISNNIISTSSNSLCGTSSLTFNGSAALVPSGSPSYQWQTKINEVWTNIDILGQNEDYNASIPLTAGVYSYRRITTDPISCTSSDLNYSNEITINQNEPIAITQQPLNKTICAGQNTSFTVGATGTLLTYQWIVSTDGSLTFKDVIEGGMYSNVKTSTLTITGAADSMNNYRYKVIVSGACSPKTSKTATLTVNSSVAVISHPSNVSTCAGSNINFSSIGSGTNLVYVWQRSVNGGSTWMDLVNSETFNGVNTSTLSITSVPNTYNGNIFRVKMIGTCGNAFSNIAGLTITSPVITGNPSNVTLCSGQNTVFSSSATGAISYQWEVSTDGGSVYSILPEGGVYSNVTSNSLSITNAEPSMNGAKFRVIASGSCGPTATSMPATLTVNTPVSVISHPTDVFSCVNANVAFSAGVTGSGLVYVWQRSNNGGSTWSDLLDVAPYSNTRTATLNISSVESSFNGYLFRTKLIGSCGTVYTNNATLNITSPIISSHPTDVIGCAGGNASFTVSSTGGISYQWQVSTDGGTVYNDIVNGGIYSNATTSTLNVTGVNISLNNYKYRSVLTGGCSVIINSNPATLTVGSATLINSHPVNTGVCSGSNTSLSTSASGSGITYQWQRSKNGGSTWANLANSTIFTGVYTNSLNILSVPASYNNNWYRCMITNSYCGPVYTDIAILTVTACRIGIVDTEETDSPSLIYAYPNPFESNISLAFQGYHEDSNIFVSVKDINGRMVYSKENHSPNETLIFGNEFGNGIYFVEVRTATALKVLKIIKAE